MAKDMMKTLAESLASTKEELVEAMRLDKFKKLTTVQFEDYLADKKRTLEAAARKIGDGTVDSVLRLLPELDKDYFSLYVTDPLKQKMSEAKSFFANGFTTLFKGVIQSSTQEQIRRFTEAYHGFKARMAVVGAGIVGGIGSAVQSTQDLATAGAGFASQVGTTFNQALHDTNAAFNQEAQRSAINPLEIPVVTQPVATQSLPMSQQVIQVRDSSNMGVRTTEFVDSATGMTQTAVARR